MLSALLRWTQAPLLLLGALIAPLHAHDLPGKVSLLVYVKHTPEEIAVLTRVPMEALGEIQFPVRGPGHLDFATAANAVEDAATIYIRDGLRVYADGKELPLGQVRAARVALPSDKSFAQFDSALAVVQSPPLDNSVDLYWKQGWLDALIVFPGADRNATLAVESALARVSQETHTVLHFIDANGTERVFTFVGDPGRIELDPSWWRAAAQFTHLGFVHILEGVDHLLFLLCLVVAANRLRTLIPVVTGFTLAHSITLISAALGLVPTATWFGSLIEAAIALSVFYMACENAVGAAWGIAPRKRELIVFAFGLVHGFGFSFILADRMQFAGEHLLSALVAFNVGVEMGQLAVLAVTVPILRAIYSAANNWRKDAAGGRTIAILISILVAHTAWHWLIERADTLTQFAWTAPTLDAAFAAAALRWAMLAVASAAALWAMHEAFQWWERRRSPAATPLPAADNC